MILIVGLGNPGQKYFKTRHNAGFLALDYFTLHHHLKFSSHKFNCEWAEGAVLDLNVGFIKPQTYMNLSGKAVREFSAFYKISPENIIVLHDDIDLSFGQIKHKARGGDAGHQGVRSIVEELGTDQFHRLRIGIGRPLNASIDISDFVLSSFTDEELSQLSQTFETTREKLEKLLAEQTLA